MNDDERDNGCLCQRCGFRYRVDVILPDSLWARIHGPYNLLCGMCVTSLTEGVSQFDYFNLLKLDQYSV